PMCSYLANALFLQKATSWGAKYPARRVSAVRNGSRMSFTPPGVYLEGGRRRVEPVSPDVTSLLKKLANGNQEAGTELIPVIYQELHRLAVGHLRRERPDPTLQPTQLVQDAYIKLDARQGRIVELRYFGGLTVEEAAEILGVSPTTVRREWTSAKAWLYGELKERHGDHA